MASQFLLRWVGGAGGDTIINLLSKKNDVYLNVNPLYKIDAYLGKSIITNKFDKKYPNLVKLTRAHPQINKTSLLNDLINLKNDHKSFVLKCHLFNQEIDEELKKNNIEIVDIGFDIKFLPFIIQSNLLKTETVKSSRNPERTHYDKNLIKISNKLTEKQNISVVTWTLIQDMIMKIKQYNLKNTLLKTKDLFYNIDSIADFFKKNNLILNVRSKYLKNWQEKNQNILPSKTFIEYVDNMEYNYNDSALQTVERYILLMLSGNKFKFLE